jgi:hypothetical protein
VTGSTAKTSPAPRRKSALPSSKGSAKSGSAILRLNDDWSAFLGALISTGTRFLLIGGHAIGVHAEPRFTEDLDVFVAPDRSNARRLRAALVEFGFGDIAPSIKELAQSDRVWMLGRKPRRIDILTGISGVTFERASRGRRLVSVAGLSIPVIGRSALLANKKASGRPKDLIDIVLLGTHPPKRRQSPGRSIV